MTSYTPVDSLLVDSIVMIALDKEEREKTHLIHEAIAKEKGVIIDEVDLSDVVRMIYITGMAEYGVETKREKAQRLRWEEVHKKMDEYARMDVNMVEFNTDRFVEALMKKRGGRGVSDLDVLMNVMGTLENLQMEISHSEIGMDMYHVLRERVNGWIDQVIEMIDDYEEGEL